MFDNLFNLDNSKTEGANEIERRVHAREKHLAIQIAEYPDEVREPSRLADLFKGLPARFFGRSKTSPQLMTANRKQP
jgi:hypothetical protein